MSAPFSKNPFISIIVPNYNHVQFLEQRLTSIYKQTYQNFEVIILDDASADSSLEILRVYKNHPKTSHFIINEKNTGSPFKQWKKGLELANGEFIWIAESDDSCELDFLEKQIVAIQSYDVVVAQTKTFTTEGLGKNVIHPAFKNGPVSKFTIDSLLRIPILNVSTTLFKNKPKAQFKKSHFATFSIIGDRVFYYEFFLGDTLFLNQETTSYFRQEGTGLSNLDTKGLKYLAAYFYEHVQFIEYVKKREVHASKEISKKYMKRFFKRVRDRLSRDEKRSLPYLKLYLYYKFKMLTT